MSNIKSVWVWVSLIILFSLALAFYNFNHNTSGYLTFSDAAKYGDIAKNIYYGKGFTANFTFFGPHLFTSTQSGIFPARGISVFTPFVISIFFRLFGISDFSVIGVSLFFFTTLLVGVFLLAKSIFKNNDVALCSLLVVGTNLDLQNYALSGGTEAIFIAQTVWAIYLVSLKKSMATTISAIILVCMYLTRPQAFINIGATIIFYLLTRYNIKKAVGYFVLMGLTFIFADYFLLPLLPQNIYFVSVLHRGTELLTQYLPGSSFSESLRGHNVTGPIMIAIKKLFYVSYNFYKLLPQIVNPYLTGFFVVGLFISVKDRVSSAFKMSILFLVVSTFFITALSIPFFRYLHPVIPFVYMFAVNVLFLILAHFIKNKNYILPTLTLLVLFFTVGQTVGVIFLDSRNTSKSYNRGKDPVYVQLSQILKQNTNDGDIIITNLDTWGSWYGDRSTVWFPLEPKQLIDPKTNTIPFDAIFLTSYLINDPNYQMGDEWHQIFDNPGSPKKWICNGCEQIVKEFNIKGIYTISSDANYEGQGAGAMLLVRK